MSGKISRREELSSSISRLGGYGLIASGVLDDLLSDAGRVVSVPSEMVFESDLARDSYFASNPDKLVDGVYATSSSTDTAREIRARVRESATGPWFQFQSDVFSAAGNRWQHVYLHVPSGWQYAILSSSGISNSTIDAWFEMW